MTKCIAFHSYKGGTGKTTIAANFGALLAKKGYNVYLLDLDVYAPSLGSYFDIYEPKKWINDFLLGNASVDDVCMDITRRISDDMKGTLNVGFANSSKEEIYKLEGNVSRQSSQMQLLRNFILLREELFVKKNADFVIIDTSPGIRYWSINTLAVSDIVILTLKMGDLDIEGTKKMAQEIYGAFTKFGTLCYLLLNRGPGYCSIPESQHNPVAITIGREGGGKHHDNSIQYDSLEDLSNTIDIGVISEIPCYCDIQFSKKEFLTGIQYPEHPFTLKLLNLANKLETNETYSQQ
ncbi:MAG TPA: MinD/ParA family protein [Nitrososphaeraceae archaeon]|nr:MinD/ParA family protein [Nitrososphaeraceae archaeon]